MTNTVDTLQRWTDTRQRVTSGQRSGHVIGYTALDGNPYQSRAQIQIATGQVEWIPLVHLHELGLTPRP